MRGVEGIGAGRAQTLFLGSRRATTNHVCVEAWVRHRQNLAGLAPLFLPQDCLERISNLAKQGSSVFKKRENPDRSLGIHGGCYTEMLLHSHSWRQIAAFPRGFSEICWLAYSTPLFIFLGVGLYCPHAVCAIFGPFNHVTIKHEGSVGHRGHQPHACLEKWCTCGVRNCWRSGHR